MKDVIKVQFFAKLGTRGAPENLIPFATPIAGGDPLTHYNHQTSKAAVHHTPRCHQ